MSIQLFFILIDQQVEELLSVLLSAACAASGVSQITLTVHSRLHVIDSLYENIVFAVRGRVYWYVVFVVLNGDILNVLCLIFAFYGDATYGDL